MVHPGYCDTCADVTVEKRPKKMSDWVRQSSHRGVGSAAVLDGFGALWGPILSFVVAFTPFRRAGARVLLPGGRVDGAVGPPLGVFANVFASARVCRARLVSDVV